MAFVEADRVQIRKFLGFASLFLQADSRLEDAITSLQSITDGGTRPDSSAETEAKAVVTKLQAIDTQIDALMVAWGAIEVDGGEAKLDTARETARLRSVGRTYVTRLARMFDTHPRSDAFSSSTTYGGDPPFVRSGY